MADEDKPVDKEPARFRFKLPFRTSQKVLDTLVVSGVVAIVVAVATFSFDLARSRYNESLDEHVLALMKKEKFSAGVVELIKKELDKPQGGSLSESLRAVLNGLREREVGALTAGAFVLSPDRQTYNLYIYVPRGHKAWLDFDIDWVDQKPQPIVAVMPDGKTKSFTRSPKDGIWIPLPTPGQPGTFEAESGPLDNLYAITFQVKDNMTGKVDIKYAAFVSPVIQFKR